MSNEKQPPSQVSRREFVTTAAATAAFAAVLRV
jgi:hypothetical protein